MSLRPIKPVVKISPRSPARTQPQRISHHERLTDDPFVDASFPWMSPSRTETSVWPTQPGLDPDVQYYPCTPASASNTVPSPAMSHARGVDGSSGLSHPPSLSQSIYASRAGSTDVKMEAATPMAIPSEHIAPSNALQLSQSLPDQHGSILYPAHPGFHPSPLYQHATHYHPYPMFRSPRFHQPQVRPASPQLSMTSTSSVPSHIFHMSVASASPGVAPSLVSPASAMSALSTSDVSPPGIWPHALPNVGGGPESVSSWASMQGTPLNTMSALPSVPLASAYGLSHTVRSPSRMGPERALRPRPARTAVQSARNRQVKEEESDSDDSDDLGQGSPVRRRVALFRPGIDIMLPKDKEITRLERIQNEQRRRDEMKIKFQNLREVLPSTPVKVSKSNLLEAAVQHIIHIGNQDRVKAEQIAKITQELEDLRRSNGRLAEALAARGISAAYSPDS